MKSLLLVIAAITSFVFFVTQAEASRPCKTIVKACMSAGVIQRGDSKDMIMSKCVKPVLGGESIKGVNVDSMTIKACESKMSSMKK